MTRLIDADALKMAFYYAVSKGTYGEFMDGSEVSFTDREILQLIDEQPTIDAVPVIRCKDCKNWEADEDERCMYCGEGVLPKTEACMGFGYCSMAEPKDG